MYIHFISLCLVRQIYKPDNLFIANFKQRVKLMCKSQKHRSYNWRIMWPSNSYKNVDLTNGTSVVTAGTVKRRRVCLTA